MSNNIKPKSREETAILQRGWGVCYSNGEALPVPPSYHHRPSRFGLRRGQQQNKRHHAADWEATSRRAGQVVMAINLGLGDYAS